MVQFNIVCILLSAFFQLTAGVGTEKYFNNKIDHFGTSTKQYKQRYYIEDAHFEGAGHPLFVIMGGEGSIPPEVGLFYPFVYDDMAQKFGALVVEPEHRFYGKSMPFGDSSHSSPHSLQMLSTPQALADAADFIVAMQKEYGCTERGTPGYCPVITVGGSYPGFLAAMMRIRYPAVVDIGYAASAPMLFYSQHMDPAAYYRIITDSAERAVPGCANAVRSALALLLATPQQEVVRRLNLCSPVADYITSSSDPSALFFSELLMVIQVQFANANMANYPPSPDTALSQSCAAFVSHDPWTALKGHLAPLVSSEEGCFDFVSQVPAGRDGTVACGDWSGCGSGTDGESWDYQTCSFLVEPISTTNVTDMFPRRDWTMDWLINHCQTRFGVEPQPRALADDWGFDLLAEQGVSRIIFTNGLNDGWSAGGFTSDLSPDLPVLNMPNGAHHSDLSHSPPSDADTPDVAHARDTVVDTIAGWLAEL